MTDLKLVPNPGFKSTGRIPFEPVLLHSSALVAAVELYEDETGQTVDELAFARALMLYEEAS